MVLADGGFSANGQYFITPAGRNDYVDEMMVDARARHKTVNKQFKEYNILKNMYRGELGVHHQIFKAVINLVHMWTKNDKVKVFQIELEDQ